MSNVTEAIKKGSCGEFSYWLAGKTRWEVRTGSGEIVAVRQNLADAAQEAAKLHYAAKADVRA